MDEKELLARSLRIGKQRVLQKRLHSPESVTLELFKNAVALARHRELLETTGADAKARRDAFAATVAHLADELGRLAAHQGARRPGGEP